MASCDPSRPISARRQKAINMQINLGTSQRAVKLSIELQKNRNFPSLIARKFFISGISLIQLNAYGVRIKKQA